MDVLFGQNLTKFITAEVSHTEAGFIMVPERKPYSIGDGKFAQCLCSKTQIFSLSGIIYKVTRDQKNIRMLGFYSLEIVRKSLTVKGCT